MGDTSMLAGLPVLDYIVRWLILMAFFLLLTSVFREKLTLEGMIGYGFACLVIPPLNMYAQWWGMRFLPGETFMALLLMSAALLIFLNLLFLYLASQIVPGVTFMGLGWLVLFSLVFSLGAAAVRYIPRLPEIPVGSISDW